LKYIITILFIISIVLVFNFSLNEKPLISEKEFDLIKNLDLNNSFLVSEDKYYSPWLLYSNAKIIAPGMFDYDKLSHEEWIIYWNSEDSSDLLNRYEKPLYVYSKNKKECFEEYQENIYEFVC